MAVKLVMKNEVLECIKSRRSIRKYKEEQITDEQLMDILEAGTYAASSMGRQGAQIVAVQDKALIEKLSALNGEFFSMDSDPYYHAPTVLLVFANGDNANWIQDGACVLNNMMIAANALGLGTCWINREIEMFDDKEGKKFMKQWGIGDNMKGVGALTLGYPDGDIPKAAPRKEDFYKIIK